MMKLQCKHVEASQAGDEIFQVHFEVKRDDLDAPYVLIQRAWLEEDEDEFSMQRDFAKEGKKHANKTVFATSGSAAEPEVP